MKLGMRQIYALVGGLLLGLGLTRLPAYDGVAGLAVITGLGVGLMVLSLIRA